MKLSREEIQKLIQEFERYYLEENLRCKAKKLDTSHINFRTFISQPKYNPLKTKLEDSFNESYNNLEQLIFENLTEEQKRRVGSLFHNNTEEFFDSSQSTLNRKVDIIESHITNSQEYKGFLNIRDHLTEQQEDSLASKISKILYDRLSNEEKKLISEGTIKRYLMGLGFVAIKRAGYKETINFIKKYPALFKNEREVVDAILERYIDEELTKASVLETSKRVKELKEEAKELYKGIK